MVFTPDALLEKLAAWPKPCRYWVAYSGGLDSTVLAHALAYLRPRLRAPCCLLHVHHGLQEAADEWLTHCEDFAASLDLELASKRITIARARGESPEAAARAARYAVFMETLTADDMLLLAQHQDDQLETFLLQLMRGAGPAGLASMPELIKSRDVWLARPLLSYARAELFEYARAEALQWVEDPSNQELSFDRNYLRHRIIPPLRARWPAAGKTVARAATHCAEANQLLGELAAIDLKRCQSTAGRLSVAALETLTQARASNLLRHWLNELGLAPPPANKLAAVFSELLSAGPDRHPLIRWNDVELRRYHDEVHAMSALPSPPDRPLPMSHGQTLLLPADLGRIRLADDTAGQIAATAVKSGPVEIRWRTGSENIKLNGHHRSLKKLLQSAAILPWMRSRLPLVYSDGKLLAVADLWVDESVLAQRDEAGLQVIWEDHPPVR